MVLCCAATLAACGGPNPGNYSSGSGKIDPKYGVAASPRVVGPGEPVPKGGGRYQVGRAYTVAGKRYVPYESSNYSRTGTASWYGDAFHGRRTANGEVFDKASLSAAHPTLPLPSYVRVTNTGNGRSMLVRVNDRGPYHGGRLIDVSQRVAEALDFKRMGTARVKVDYVGPAAIAGSDDSKLLASLRINGAPSAPAVGEVLLASADGSGFGSLFSRPKPAEPPPAPPVVRRAPEPPAAPVAVALATPPIPREAPAKVVRGLPMPPDRPYELGAPTRVAAVAVAAVHAPAPMLVAAPPTPPPRPRVASLYFAPPAAATARFQQGSDPFAGLKLKRFEPIALGKAEH